MSATDRALIMEPYRVGGGQRAPHWAHRWHVDFWFRSWQSECPELCRSARRAWTASGARRKMARDVWLAEHGVTSIHQARMHQAAGRYRTGPDGGLIEVLPRRVWGRRR